MAKPPKRSKDFLEQTPTRKLVASLRKELKQKLSETDPGWKTDNRKKNKKLT
jgi:uncharacterized protein YcnI